MYKLAALFIFFNNFWPLWLLTLVNQFSGHIHFNDIEKWVTLIAVVCF